MKLKRIIGTLLILSAISITKSVSCRASVPERLAIMTDRICYAPGERVWMRAFMVEAISGKPLLQSRFVHVDLLVEGNVTCSQVSLKEQGGIFCGYIDIPPEIGPGKMHLRAYTRAIANIPSLECITPIYVREAPDGIPSGEVAKPDFSPLVLVDKLGGKLSVGIILPEECSKEKISMAISVSNDKFSVHNGITAKIRSEVPEGTQLVITPEKSQRLQGRVIAPENRKDLLQGAEVTIFSVENGFQASTTADDKGLFEFDDLEIAGTCTLLVKASSEDGKYSLETEIDDCSLPSCRYLDYNGNIIEDESGYIDKDAIILDEAVILDQKREETGAERNLFLKLASKSFDEEALEEINPSGLEDIILLIPGLYVNAEGQVCSQQRASIYDDNHITIAINGVIFDGDDDFLSNMSMSEIERVDYFRPSESVIWGHYGNGVLSISTKSGTSRRGSNIREITVPGFQQYVPFAPSSSGKTVFWNPCIVTEGPAYFTFQVPAGKGLFVHVEGISDSGKTLSAWKQITE